MMVPVIETEENIWELLPFLDEVVDERLIAVSDVELIKCAHQQNAT